ncbi:MAG: response regulator [candidate division Zixibacteria bacterium]|nr:response regulator [candidate division Zixibacteria bacterium]
MRQDNINILVVDDELLIRDLLYDFLGSRGYTVFLAENGNQAIDMIETVDFQVALLDLKMPEKSGLEVMEVIAAKKPFVPVILMTAYPSLDSAIESVKLGAFEYLIKPFKISMLEEVARKAADEYANRVKTNYVRKNTADGKSGHETEVSK